MGKRCTLGNSSGKSGVTTSGISQARRQTHAADTAGKGVCPRLRDSQGMGRTDAGNKGYKGDGHPELIQSWGHW